MRHFPCMLCLCDCISRDAAANFYKWVNCPKTQFSSAHIWLQKGTILKWTICLSWLQDLAPNPLPLAFNPTSACTVTACWPLYRTDKDECHWRVRYLTRLGSGLYGGGGLQWEADTIVWLLWLPFMSPLACMWWLLSMLEPARRRMWISKWKHILNESETLGVRWPLTHMSEGGGGSVVLLGLLPHQVDWGGFADVALVVKLVHVGQWRVRGGGWDVAPEESHISVWWIIKPISSLVLIGSEQMWGFVCYGLTVSAGAAVFAVCMSPTAAAAPAPPAPNYL